MRSNGKLLVTLSILLGVWFLAPQSVHAQTPWLEYCGNPSVLRTAVGCIDTNPQSFLTVLLKVSIGIAGGIAFLIILFGGLQMQTSAGNPERLHAGREMVASAVAGLLLIVFSVFILKLVGVDLLSIPGFQ